MRKTVPCRVGENGVRVQNSTTRDLFDFRSQMGVATYSLENGTLKDTPMRFDDPAKDGKAVWHSSIKERRYHTADLNPAANAD